MAAFANTDRTLTALDRPVTLFAHEVTPNLFDVAGIQAFRGRTFLPDEGLQGKDDVALISYALWRSTFGGDSDTLLSRTIGVDLAAGPLSCAAGVAPFFDATHKPNRE